MEEHKEYSANGLLTEEIHYGQKNKPRKSKNRDSKSKPRDSK